MIDNSTDWKINKGYQTNKILSWCQKPSGKGKQIIDRLGILLVQHTCRYYYRQHVWSISHTDDPHSCWRQAKHWDDDCWLIILIPKHQLQGSIDMHSKQLCFAESTKSNISVKQIEAYLWPKFQQPGQEAEYSHLIITYPRNDFKFTILLPCYKWADIGSTLKSNAHRD